LISARTRIARRNSDRMARREFKEVLADLQPSSARIPAYSSVTGDDLGVQLVDDAHWMANLRSPVHISTAMRKLAEDGHDTFLEIGPHLAVEGEATLAGPHGKVLPSIRHGESERMTMMAALGGLYSSGQTIDWKLVHPPGRRLVTAPTYPWQRERFWLDDVDGADPGVTTVPQNGTAVGAAQVDETREPNADFVVMLGRADDGERQRLLRSYLRDHAAAKLGMTPSDLDTELTLTNSGVDSLMATELRTQIQRDIGILVPVVEFLDGPSISSLADWLVAAMSVAAQKKPNDVEPVAADRAAEASDLADTRWIDLLTQVAEVSDDDVDALLREVLQVGE
jgi:acyl transferase domain-containing protein